MSRSIDELRQCDDANSRHKKGNAMSAIDTQNGLNMSAMDKQNVIVKTQTMI